MKPITYLLMLLLFSCINKTGDASESDNLIVTDDTVQIQQPAAQNNKSAKVFSNERFRKVTLEKVEAHKYRIQGEAQVFEGNFNWVVEDGHYELKSAFETTTAGAPEWGKFDFTISVEKKDKQTKLHLILFEVSPKDGSRQYELSIPLH